MNVVVESMEQFLQNNGTQIRTPTWEEGHRGDTAIVQKILKGVENVGSE